MRSINELDSVERGDYGEDRAKVFLRSLFGEITNRPSPDRGTDIICSSPRWIPTLGSTTSFRFQVKSGHSYNRSIRFAPRALDQLLQRIEGEPLIVLYYHDSTAAYTTPDCFLVLNTWILRHVNQVRVCLAADKELPIPHTDFEHLVRDELAPLKAAMGDEFRRASSHRGHMLASRYDQLPEYSYIRQFARVVRIWDISLLPSPEMKRLFGVAHPSEIREHLLRATDSEATLSAILQASGRTNKHPLNRLPEIEVEVVQSQYYKALLEHGAGRSFYLPQSFTVSASAAGRAMAAKYPNLVTLVEQVFHEWHRRPVLEVLNATQVAGALSHYEKDAEDRVIAALRQIELEIRHMPIRDFHYYRLSHHVYQALAESTGDSSAAKEAIDLAFKFLHWELQHLEDYGWRVGPHVLDLYHEAEQNTSLRGQKLRDYNRGMRELMGLVVG